MVSDCDAKLIIMINCIQILIDHLNDKYRECKMITVNYYFRFLKQFSLVPRQTNVLFSKRHVGFL